MSKVIYLSVPTLESWQWQDRTVYRDMGTATFFHPDGKHGGIRHRHAAAVEVTCANCSILEQYCSYALATYRPYGIWDGITEKERATYQKSQEAKTA